jgi:hypothetical protein
MQMSMVFTLFLLVFATPVLADKQQDEFDKRSVYDAFAELKPKLSPGVTLEEDVTSRIKRYIAGLLYPVDMTSLVRPEKDAKLRELIVTLQKQMGEATTGVLTYGQFSKLQDAARAIDERPITVAPGKMVYSEHGSSVGALGTGVMNDLANPLNVSRILCTKSGGACEMSGAEFDQKYGMLIASAPVIYEIKTWTPHRVTALREHPCGTALLMVDVDTQDVTITSAPHADLPFCSKEPADIWSPMDLRSLGTSIETATTTRATWSMNRPERCFRCGSQPSNKRIVGGRGVESGQADKIHLWGQFTMRALLIVALMFGPTFSHAGVLKCTIDGYTEEIFITTSPDTNSGDGQYARIGVSPGIGNKAFVVADRMGAIAFVELNVDGTPIGLLTLQKNMRVVKSRHSIDPSGLVLAPSQGTGACTQCAGATACPP